MTHIRAGLPAPKEVGKPFTCARCGRVVDPTHEEWSTYQYTPRSHTCEEATPGSSGPPLEYTPGSPRLGPIRKAPSERLPNE
jgi:hypothetical protein